MSSCPSNPSEERFSEIQSIRTQNAEKEVEARLWDGIVAECLLPDDLGGVIDMAFQVDRKALVVRALKNIIVRLEET